MKIDCLVLGAYETNCYILRESESAGDCLIIDTGLEAGGLIDFLCEYKLNPVALILTHGHIDHINGLAQLRKNFSGVKAYVHKLDAKILTDRQSNLSFLAGLRPATNDDIEADFTLEEGSIVEQAGIKLEVLHTPGHTRGGISLSTDGVLFVGDTLFAGSIGRTDFPGGDYDTLIASIQNKLFPLGDDVRVLSGHGPETTIAHEKAYNQYLR